LLTPEIFSLPVLSWYQQRGPHMPVPGRGSRDPYAVWVAEIMLQQTQVATVGSYYGRWMKRYPDVRSLAAAARDEVLKHWEGLGYYSRARNLHEAARLVVANHAGNLPERYADWLKLPGVGPYTAAAVASIACGEDVAAVDGNVLRVVARFNTLSDSIDDPPVRRRLQVELTTNIPRGSGGDFNQALMDLGREICTPRKPHCTDCPLQENCQAHTKDQTSEYPRRKKRKPVPRHRVVVGLIRKGEQVLIQRRPETGLLGGLWEFPGGMVEAGETLEMALVREILEETGLEVEVVEEITTLHHAYTHFRIHLTAFWCTLKTGSLHPQLKNEQHWVNLADLSQYAFPKANLKILSTL